MNKMNSIVPAVLIIITILIISFVIFAPKSKNFYNCKDTYPYILDTNLNIEKDIKNIRTELDALRDEDWIDYYGKEQWNNNAEFKILPLYMRRQWIQKNMSKCNHLLETLCLPHVRNIFLCRFKEMSKINEWREYDEMCNMTLRCCIGLRVKSFGSRRVNLWINGEIKEISTGSILLMDNSKSYSICNDTKEKCILLCIDIDRPESSPRGTGSDIKPDDYDQFWTAINQS